MKIFFFFVNLAKVRIIRTRLDSLKNKEGPKFWDQHPVYFSVGNPMSCEMSMSFAVLDAKHPISIQFN